MNSETAKEAYKLFKNSFVIEGRKIEIKLEKEGVIDDE